MDLLLFIVLTWRLIGCYRPHMDSTIIVSYRIVSVAGPSLSSRGLSPTPLIGNYRIVIYLAIILSYLILNFPAIVLSVREIGRPLSLSNHATLAGCDPLRISQVALNWQVCVQ